MTPTRPVATGPRDFIFDGQLLCLDFLNTRSMHRGQVVDRLTTFDDLGRWLERAEALGDEGLALVKQLRRRPAMRREVLACALALRDDVARFVDSVLAGRQLTASCTENANRVLRASPVVQGIEFADGRFMASTRPLAPHPLALLAPIAQSLRDLLIDMPHEAIRRCEDPSCVIVFCDTSKNRSRRWCSMARCGNRAKAAAFQARRRRQRRTP